MSWTPLDAVFAAWTGELGPLARSIENGDRLTEEATEFLAMYLRQEVRWPRGNKRTWSQIKRDMSIAFYVDCLRLEEGKSLDAAMKQVAFDRDMSFETVRSAVSRARDRDRDLHPKATVRP